MRFILSLAAVVPCSLMAMYISTDSIFNSPCSYNDGRIYITPTGGTGPYTYAWDDGPTIEDRTGLALAAMGSPLRTSLVPRPPVAGAST
ncbi:MAG: SprB repeat-containing protein [Flavobacteriales bacterium]|nr:SprB repeat-containing protein [Flavobacteriales bacterium]